LTGKWALSDGQWTRTDSRFWPGGHSLKLGRSKERLEFGERLGYGYWYPDWHKELGCFALGEELSRV